MKNNIMQENETHLYTSDEKLKWWGYGEWVEEPDEVHFDYLGYTCKVLRIAFKEPYTEQEYIFGGHLCGYVQIPSDHPYHHKVYEDMEIDCHGGLTFGKESDAHWIGFDCAHMGDYTPSLGYFRKISPKMKSWRETFPITEGFEEFSLFNPTYKNISYCIDECKNIVEQLIKLNQNHILIKMSKDDKRMDKN